MKAYQHPISKGTPRLILKARKTRAELQLLKSVRAEVIDRDGYCRLADTTPCNGPTELAHLEHKRRARTRGMEARERHQVEWTMALCRGHHSAYDRCEIALEFSEVGAAGSFRALIDDQLFEVA